MYETSEKCCCIAIRLTEVKGREQVGMQERAFQGRGVMFSVSVAISMATVEQVGRHLNLEFGREIWGRSVPLATVTMLMTFEALQ